LIAAGAREFALQRVGGLSRRAAAELARECATKKETAAVTEKLQTSIRLPTDKAAYAIALAQCLAPYYPTIEDLTSSMAFLLMGPDRFFDGYSLIPKP
jgi:hypothetical protein